MLATKIAAIALSSIGAAGPEIAVGLLQLEGIEVPVLALGLDDIEMGEQQKRPAGAGAAQPRHQVAFARPRRQHLDVRGGNAAGARARRRLVPPRTWG